MKLHVKISTERIKSAIAEGIILSDEIYLDVNLDELSKEDKELLSKSVEYNSIGGVFYAKYVNEYGTLETLYSKSEKLEGVISQMRERMKIREAKEEKEKKEKIIKEEIDSILSKVDSSLCIKRSSCGLEFSYEEKDLPLSLKRYYDYESIEALYDFVKSPLFEEKIKEIESLFKELETSEIQKREKEEEGKKLKEQKKEELKKWGLLNGSELLKARIEEGFNWQELANSEYFESICPEGFNEHDECVDYDECWDYNNPTLEHIQALREAKKIELFSDVYL